MVVLGAGLVRHAGCELGLSDTRVAKAVAGLPHLLGFNVECNLKPIVRCLVQCPREVSYPTPGPPIGCPAAAHGDRVGMVPSDPRKED